MYYDKKKPADQIGQHTLLVQASKQVIGFSEQIQKLKVNLSISGRTQSTFLNYSRLLAAMALHFKCLPTALSESQINDYLYFLQHLRNADKFGSSSILVKDYYSYKIVDT